MSHPWHTELGRIAILILLTLSGGMMTGHWFASICVVLAGYLIWTIYKLQQLHRWLLSGAKRKNIPDSDGLWELINLQIQLIQTKGDNRKKRMGKLLKRSRGIITSLPYATVVLNEHNEIDWANERSEQLLNIHHKKDRGQRIDNLVRLPAFNQILHKNKHNEIEIDIPRGGSGQLAIQLIPVKSDLKLLIARDISERIHIQAMRKNFIANASHELSTPLTVIKGYLEMIHADEQLPEPLKKPVNTAYQQSIRMQKLIEELLQLSRLENMDLREEDQGEIDMASLISVICEEEAAMLAEQTHRIEMDLDETLNLNGSKIEIISVCTNLIHNAIRHTPPGTRIQVSWQKSNRGEGCLMVEDDGQGIAAKHLPHLTERFYRADQGRSNPKGSTGLGLAIVQHIVQRHQGTLGIQSTIGKGSVFTVCFPGDRGQVQRNHKPS